MKPGRELDTLVAEKVLGAKLIRSPFANGDVISCDFPDRKLGASFPALPAFSTSIAAAWEIVQKFQWAEPEVGWSDEQGCWHATFWKGRNSGIAAGGVSAPHAICLAALRAEGIDDTSTV